MASDQNILRPAAKIAAAYVTAHKLEASEVARLISAVAASLDGLSASALQSGGSSPPGERIRRTPAQVRKSIRADALISFEDGQSYRALKRHLRARGLTPDAYRVKWGLPPDYPMVCADYSAVRSACARENGLGFDRRKPVRAAAATALKAAKAGSRGTDSQVGKAKPMRAKTSAGARKPATKAAAAGSASPTVSRAERSKNKSSARKPTNVR